MAKWLISDESPELEGYLITARAYRLDPIQHFVATAQNPSTHCGEQTLNPRESPIRRRFVPRLFQ